MEQYKVCGVDLVDVQKVQLGILETVDEICKKNGIKYFLSGGTLLGAVRHRGFIPWDDDIDLWMTRENYKKFKKVLEKDLAKDYRAVDYYSHIRYPLSIMKIQKNGTEYVEGVFSNLDIPSGIYIDIFPLDYIWKPAYQLQTALLIKLQAIRDYKLRKDGKKNAVLLKQVLYSLVPLRLCRGLTELTMRFFNPFKTGVRNQLCHRGRYWPKFSEEDTDDLIEMEFCGKPYPVPKNYDKILRACYGDYMKLPPEEKRQPIHNIVKCKL